MSVTPQKKDEKKKRASVSSMAEGGLSPEEVGTLAGQSEGDLAEIMARVDELTNLTSAREDVVAEIQAKMKPEERKERGALEKIGRTSLDVLAGLTGIAPLSPSARGAAAGRRKQRERENFLTGKMLELEQMDKVAALKAQQLDQSIRQTQVEQGMMELILKAQELGLREEESNFARSVSPFDAAVQEGLEPIMQQFFGEGFDMGTLTREDFPQFIDLLRATDFAGLFGGAFTTEDVVASSAWVKGIRNAVDTFNDQFKDIVARPRIDPNQLSATLSGSQTLREDISAQAFDILGAFDDAVRALAPLEMAFSERDDRGRPVWNQQEFEQWAAGVRSIAAAGGVYEVLVPEDIDEDGVIKRIGARAYVEDIIEQARTQMLTQDAPPLTGEELEREEMRSRVEGEQAAKSIENVIGQSLLPGLEEMGKLGFIGEVSRILSEGGLGMTREAGTPASEDAVDLYLMDRRTEMADAIELQHFGKTIYGIKIVDNETARQVLERVMEESGLGDVIDKRLKEINAARKRAGRRSFSRAATFSGTGPTAP